MPLQAAWTTIETAEAMYFGPNQEDFCEVSELKSVFAATARVLAIIRQAQSKKKKLFASSQGNRFWQDFDGLRSDASSRSKQQSLPQALFLSSNSHWIRLFTTTLASNLRHLLKQTGAGSGGYFKLYRPFLR